VHLDRCKHFSSAQIAVGKLLWDLYCRNALAGNSSLSFILFVCVKFPLWPHPFSHLVPRFVHPSMGRTLSVPTSSWLLQSHPSKAWLPLGSFFTSHLHHRWSADRGPDARRILLHRQAETLMSCSNLPRTLTSARTARTGSWQKGVGRRQELNGWQRWWQVARKKNLRRMAKRIKSSGRVRLQKAELKN